MGTTIITNKIIGGFLAILLILNMNLINFTMSDIKVKIHDFYNDSFHGNIIVEDHKYPIIISVEGTTTIDKKEDINKKEIRINEKVTNDKTPGKLVIKITKEGEFIFENDMGLGEKSEFDKECNKIVIDALVDYVKNNKDKKVPSKIKNFILGFQEYTKRDNANKGFINKLFPWR